MVKIRLMRMGAKKRPFFRVVVADARSPRDGRFIENIGKYHPLSHPSVIEIDEERALHWLRNGAQPTDPARVLLQKTGVWSRFTGEPAPPPLETAERASERPGVEPSDQAGEPSDSSSAARGAASEEPSGSAEGTAEAAPEGTPLVPEGDAEASPGQADDAGEERPATREAGEETP
jgi:small subunit ribosomal protein S16